MLGITHMAGMAAIMLSSSAASGVLSFSLTPLNFALGIAGSILPDIDNEKALLGRFNPLAPLIPHRSITHSILFALICFLICKPLGIGVLSHLILDLFNHAGEMLLFPFPIVVKLPVLGCITSGGIVDYFICAAFVIYDLAALFG